MKIAKDLSKIIVNYRLLSVNIYIKAE